MHNHPRRLTGDGEVIGRPSPDAEEINKSGWGRYASLDYNYRTEGGLSVAH
jgi:hypothetical protein